MIHSSRRPRGVRSLVVLTATALLGVVPLIGSGDTARADGPVGSGGERHANKGGAPYRNRSHRAAKLVATTNGPAGPLLPGQTYSWPFAVTNKGSMGVKNVTFAAPLPKSLAFVSGQQNCSWQGTMAVCQLGALKRGQTKTGMLTAKVAPKAPGGQTISAKARVSWAHSPKAKRAVVTFPKVKVAQLTDVAVTKTGPEQVQPGVPIPYKVTVTNRGTIPARLVVLRDTAAIGTHGAGACVSAGGQTSGKTAGKEKKADTAAGTNETESGAGAEAAEAVAKPRACRGHVGPLAAAPPITLIKGGATCKPAAAGVGGGLVCALGTMAPGSSKSLVFKVRPKAKPGVVIKAPTRVTTATIDTLMANNSAVARTRVAAAPRVARARVPSRSLAALPRRAPGKGLAEVPGKGLTELPSTGLPAKPFIDVALGLIGVGLIMFRLGRPRRRFDG
jgi:uncharacterized repeat protein (TIGR01451 family)